VSERTVRLEVPPHESDPTSYLRAAWRRAVEEGAERVELLVGTSDGHLRMRLTERASSTRVCSARDVRPTRASEDVHLYAIVAARNTKARRASRTS